MNQSDILLANIGNSEEYSIKDLAEIIVEKVGSDSKIVYEDLPEDDPKMRKPDIMLASAFWKPKIGLDEGLDKTIDYFRDICL